MTRSLCRLSSFRSFTPDVQFPRLFTKRERTLLVNMSKKCTNPDKSKKRVEKIKKSIHVIPAADRRNPDLHGYLYLPLDRRKQGNERVLRRVCNCEFRNSDDYEMNDLPASHYQRGYET